MADIPGYKEQQFYITDLPRSERSTDLPESSRRVRLGDSDINRASLQGKLEKDALVGDFEAKSNLQDYQEVLDWAGPWYTQPQYRDTSLGKIEGEIAARKIEGRLYSKNSNSPTPLIEPK